MKRLNFLETVGVITLATPVVVGVVTTVGFLTGYLKVYRVSEN